MTTITSTSTLRPTPSELFPLGAAEMYAELLAEQLKPDATSRFVLTGHIELTAPLSRSTSAPAAEYRQRACSAFACALLTQLLSTHPQADYLAASACQGALHVDELRPATTSASLRDSLARAAWREEAETPVLLLTLHLPELRGARGGVDPATVRFSQVVLPRVSAGDVLVHINRYRLESERSVAIAVPLRSTHYRNTTAAFG